MSTYNTSVVSTVKSATPVLGGKLNIKYSYLIHDERGNGKGNSQGTVGLTPDEVNMIFLEIQKEINSFSQRGKHKDLSFSFCLAGHTESIEDDIVNVVTINEKFFDLATTEQFLKKEMGLVTPPAENAVEDVNVETINKVYEQILQMTQKYHMDSRIKNREHELNNKEKIFNKLEAVLTNQNQTKYQRLQSFVKMLHNEDKNILNQHRTPAWIRYVSDALSFITVLPAIARAIQSYSQYGTFQFWKPASERVKATALDECKTLNIK